jgi:hypothetical protein
MFYDNYDDIILILFKLNNLLPRLSTNTGCKSMHIFTHTHIYIYIYRERERERERANRKE